MRYKLGNYFLPSLLEDLICSSFCNFAFITSSILASSLRLHWNDKLIFKCLFSVWRFIVLPADLSLELIFAFCTSIWLAIPFWTSSLSSPKYGSPEQTVFLSINFSFLILSLAHIALLFDFPYHSRSARIGRSGTDTNADYRVNW